MTLTIAPPQTPEAPVQPVPTLADVVARLGDIPLNRILSIPPPGTATEADLIAAAEAANKRLCELVDGILVEKAMGFFESRLALLLGFYLETFLTAYDLGCVFGSDAFSQLAPGQVRAPDVSFYTWDRFPNRRLPSGQLLTLAPDIAVEVISPSNTPREMRRKLTDYFASGTKRVWYVYPQERRVRVFSAIDASQDLDEESFLTDEELLPGFSLSIREWFTRADGPRE